MGTSRGTSSPRLLTGAIGGTMLASRPCCTRPSSQDSPFADEQPLPRLSIAGLLFEMGDVLYDATTWQRWVMQVLSRMGLHTHYQPFFYVWEHEYLPDVCSGRTEFWDAFGAFLRAAGLTVGQIDEVVAASQPRRRHFEQGIRPLAGVPRTLAQLASLGLYLGVVSNASCPATELAAKLRRLQLSRFFGTVVSSWDVGRAPPDAAGYRHAARELGFAPHRLAYVGHTREELEGARAAGMHTIAFNFAPDARAEVYVDRFEQLLQVVSLDAARSNAA